MTHETDVGYWTDPIGEHDYEDIGLTSPIRYRKARGLRVHERKESVKKVSNRKSQCLFCNLELNIETEGWWNIIDCPICGRYKLDSSDWRIYAEKCTVYKKKTMARNFEFRHRIKLQNYEGRTFIFCIQKELPPRAPSRRNHTGR